MTQPPHEAGATPRQVPPRCYLHPDRETYIACQRCGRPICPDCMHEASVGYQCPNCLRAGQAQVRQARTAGGGLVPGRPGVVSTTLIGINVVAYVLMMATGGLGDSVLWSWGVMLGDTAVFANGESLEVLRGVADGAYWRLLTSAFLHASVLHIAFNMYALYLFGPVLERYLGTVRFVAAYLTSAVAASVFVYVLTPPNVPTLGASGAIFALFGMALVIMFKQGQDVRGLLALVAINVVITFLPGLDISWQGHLGGFVTGLVLGAAFAYAPRARRALVQYAAFGAVWVGIVAVTILRTLQLS
ncbi:rhomboid family intramembrane serine protease [Mumia sp. Pv 4-285]|uniref:rhomboid family intramembrane serine protease n=1 Tax=Mumia qirimensis TaxID=3234852 RepID=UPI00351CB953